MKRHIDEAKSAGIEGFIVSWKSTSINNRRLEALMSVARAADFKLAIIYQGWTSTGNPSQRSESQPISSSSSGATRPIPSLISSPSHC